MNKIYMEVAHKTGLPMKVVKSAYLSMWFFLRTKMRELPLKNEMTREEFEKLRVNFNIPSLGKFHCDYDRLNSIKNKIKKNEC